MLTPENATSQIAPESISKVVNNLACIFRKRHKLQEAETLLKNGLRIERKAGANSGATALNLAGVL